TQNEVEELRHAYYFEDTDMEQFVSLDNMLEQLKEQLKSFTEKISGNEYAHSKLRTELEEAFGQLEKLEQEHETFKKSIQKLRKDELDAHDQIKQMNEEIFKTNRKLRSSNLPGVPNYIWELIEEARVKNEEVLAALDKQPLDMMDVQQALTEAKATV